jgi:MraZ protein
MISTAAGENGGEVANAPPGCFHPTITKLIGSYERNIDSKLRVGLPHQFRDRLGDSPLILVRWMKRSLALFPECNWFPFAESISRLDLYTEIGMTVRHQMFAYAREVNLDKEGRIIIPADMVEYARLDGKLMLLGDWDKIEIWNNTYYRDQVAIDEVTMSERFPAVLQLAKGQKTLDSFEEEIRKARQGTNGA